jgi:hypothetical protein
MSDINDYSDWQPDERKIKIADLPLAERELGRDEMKSVEGGSTAASDEARSTDGIISKFNELLDKLGVKSPFGES